MPFSGTSYDPETLALLTRAFNAAWRERETVYPGRSYNAAITPKLMALRIMEAADFGERDLGRLKLRGIGGHDVDQTPLKQHPGPGQSGVHRRSSGAGI